MLKPNTQLVTDLLALKERIGGPTRWCRGTPQIGRAVCLMRAASTVCEMKFDGSPEDESAKDRYVRLYTKLAIETGLPLKDGAPYVVTDYNDRHCKTWRDAVALVDRAIERELRNGQ